MRCYRLFLTHKIREIHCTLTTYYAILGISVGMREDDTRSYFLTDHLGSIVGVTDSSGVLVSETRYLPFGETRTDVGNITETDYGYTNQQIITGTGLTRIVRP